MAARLPSPRAEAAAAALGVDVVAGAVTETGSFFLTVPASSGVVMFRGAGGDQAQRTFAVDSAGGPLTMLFTERFERSTMTRRFQVPFNGRGMYMVQGNCEVSVTNDGLSDATIEWVFTKHAAMLAPVAPFCAFVEGLVAVPVSLLPGAWTVFPTQGWDDRTTIMVTTDGPLDFQYVNIVTSAQVGFFTLNGVGHEMLVPPHFRLRVRHPGGATDTRVCFVTLRRS